MSITKRNTIICDRCGLFCKPYDISIPYGTKSYSDLNKTKEGDRNETFFA